MRDAPGSVNFLGESMAGQSSGISVDMDKVASIQAALEALADEGSGVRVGGPANGLYGDSGPGRALEKDVSTASGRINDSITNICDGAIGLSDAVGEAARALQEADQDTSVALRGLGDSTALIQTKFYDHAVLATRPDKSDANVLLHFDPETGGKTPIYPV